MFDNMRRKVHSILERKYNESEINRVYVLYYLNIALSLMLILLLVLLFIFNSSLEPMYLLLIVLLIIFQFSCIFLNLFGYYKTASWITILAAFSSVWGSVLYDNIIGIKDLFPVFYISLVIFLSSILLSKKSTVIVAVIQIIGLIIFFSRNPQLTNQNLPSLFSFIVMSLILVYVSSWINENQVNRISKQNVTLKKQEKILKNDEERYRGLVDHLNSGIVVHGPNTEVLDCNQNAVDILGLTKKQIEGKTALDPYWEFIDENYNKLPLEEYPVMKAKNTMKSFKDYVIGIRQKDSVDWVSVNAYVRLDSSGEIIEIIVSFINITKEYKYKNQLLEMSYEDSLTGLYNRRYYEEQIEYLEFEGRYPISIIMADINGLKLVNDAFGHEVGDLLIKRTADLLREYTPQTAINCRLGGDEFIVILSDINEKEANDIAIILNNNASKISVENITLSISFGIATKHDEYTNLNQLFRIAEDRMYQSKLIEVPSMRRGAIDAIIRTLYEKDKYSEQHVKDVSNLSSKIAEIMNLSSSMVNEIKTAGLLHDIGKIIIPSPILNKNSKLTQEEYEQIKKHSEIGFRILNSSSDTRQIAKIILYHHERWDGNGYPHNLKGEDIPLLSRIITVADAFDAMISYRPYRESRSKEEALLELIRCSGSQFDPNIVSIFKENFNEITKWI